MTNVFNYRFKDYLKAIEKLDILDTKLNNKNSNYKLQLEKSSYGYWNLKLSITNEQSNKTEIRTFNTTV